MPGWLATVSRFNPLTLTVDAWRGALLHGEMPALRSLLLLAALAVVLFLFALSRMRASARHRQRHPSRQLDGQVLTLGLEPVYVRAGELPPQLADDSKLRIEKVDSAPRTWKSSSF
jgi:hypothetical protein